MDLEQIVRGLVSEALYPSHFIVKVEFQYGYSGPPDKVISVYWHEGGCLLCFFEDGTVKIPEDEIDLADPGSIEIVKSILN